MKNGGKTLDPLLVSRAIVVWIGKGKSAWPHRDKERLVQEFGIDLAARLHPVVKELVDEFFCLRRELDHR
jgi:hypothetical protein